MTDSLCETCQHSREVRTPTSLFLLCKLSHAESDFPKYPRQPVVRCSGFEPREAAPPVTPAS